MKLHTSIFLIMALTTAYMAVADAIVFDFSSGIPKSITLEDGDNGVLKPKVYNHIDANTDSWTAGRLGDGHGQVAFSPTRYTDGNLTSRNLLILPSAKIDSDSAYLRWESRSMLKCIAERYHVLARTDTSQPWDTLYTCQAENYEWTYHVLPLSEYQGKSVHVAFESATTNGFMLALDNIFLGIPSQDKPLIKVEQLTPHFIGEDDESQISVRIANYGAPLGSNKIAIVNDGLYAATCDIPQIACGESTDVIFDVKDIPLHEKYDFLIVALLESGDINLFDLGWVYRSHYRRVAFVDRGSGTWCNNCPAMELTTSRLENFYGDQLIVAESHLGNDVLANAEYLNDYLNDFMRGVPALVPNHRKDKVKYSVKDTDDLSDLLIEPTVARINAVYSVSGDEININAECEFAEDTSNDDDRYTVGYMLLADYHNPKIYAYTQSNSATTNSKGQYYYMPSYILPEMMWFDNVTTGCATATKGVLNSVPSDIEGKKPFVTGYTIPVPGDMSIVDWRVAAYIIDNSDGHIVNAAIAKKGNTDALSTITSDSQNSSTDQWYTLQGIKLSCRPNTPGVYINCGKKILITK